MNNFIDHIFNIPRRVNAYIHHRIVPKLLVWKVNLEFTFRRSGKAHGLPSSLIISLTSYPARFKQLPLTLKSLLTQTMGPDRIILWIAHEDKSSLTPDILALLSKGLEIIYCEDLRSYKKIIPCLKHYPDSFIVTADDDVYYWPTWLEELVNGYNEMGKYVICHRAHCIRLNADNEPLPYKQWELNAKPATASKLNFQTGIGGVLYPPHTFHKDVLQVDIFQKLCPFADDVWLYWMMRLGGNSLRCVQNKHELHPWKNTQESALFHNNVAGGGNDDQINAMMSIYGFPLSDL